MPIRFAGFDDDFIIFPYLNFVLVGYLLLILFPSSKFTSIITLIIPGLYSLLYLLLTLDYIYYNNHKLNDLNFSSLQGIITLFQDSSVVMAGWTHYIAFDLMVCRYIVLDALSEGISHLLIIPIIPITLMLGPIGLFSYLLLKFIHQNKRLKSIVVIILNAIVYVVVTVLCVFMFVLIFISPATVRLGIPALADIHREKIIQIFQRVPMKIPIQVILKYYKQIDIVSLHIFPAGIWTLLAPIQLFNPIRKYIPIIHRLSGYIFFMTVPLITIGVFLIFYRKLDFEYDYPMDLPNYGFSEYGLSPFVNSLLYFKIYMIILSIYFLLTAIISYQYVRAKKYQNHYQWIVRHISSGIWVALLRLYVTLRKAPSIGITRAAFYDGSIIFPLLTILIGELYIRLSVLNLRNHYKKE